MKKKDDNLEKINIVFLGGSGVGKTYFSRKFINDLTKLDYYLFLTGLQNCFTQRILSDGNKYEIKIYDISGQNRFEYTFKHSIKQYDGAILMYDITDRYTFDLISERIDNKIYYTKDEDFL